MKQLSSEQHELVLRLARRLGTLRGIKAVVLGGSQARGRAQPDSDIDLGVQYAQADARLKTTLAGLGGSAAKLEYAVENVQELLRETIALAGDLYQPRYELPK